MLALLADLSHNNMIFPQHILYARFFVALFLLLLFLAARPFSVTEKGEGERQARGGGHHEGIVGGRARTRGQVLNSAHHAEMR